MFWHKLVLQRSWGGGLPVRNVVVLGWLVGGRQVFRVIVCSWELKLVVFWDLISGIWVSGGCWPWLFSTLLWWISSPSHHFYSPSLLSVHKGLNKAAQEFPTPISFLSLVLMPLKTQGLSFWPCPWGCTSLYITMASSLNRTLHSLVSKNWTLYKIV